MFAPWQSRWQDLSDWPEAMARSGVLLLCQCLTASLIGRLGQALSGYPPPARTLSANGAAHGSPASIRLDVGVLDHLAPLDELGLHVVSQLLRRAGKTLKADILESRLNIRAVDDLA